MKNNILQEERKVYLDYLRIIATIAVIILHVSAKNWYYVDLTSFEWKVFNSVDASVQWAVPIFVMISGALFLDNSRSLNTKKLYKYNIFRMVITLAVWSAIYALDKLLCGTDLKTCVAVFIQGNYHLWYLYMVLGLYIFTPIIRKITVSKPLTEYFLILAVILGIIFPRLLFVLKCINIPHTQFLLNNIEIAFSKIHINLTEGYIFYYVLGFYLSKYSIDKKWCRASYLSGILGYILIVLLTDWYSKKTGSANGEFYSYFSINVMFMAIGIFIFFKSTFFNVQLSGKELQCVKKISKYTFGIYLVHALIMEKFCAVTGITTTSLNAILAIIIITVGVTGISYVISAMLNHLPILNKYIV